MTAFLTPGRDPPLMEMGAGLTKEEGVGIEVLLAFQSTPPARFHRREAPVWEPAKAITDSNQRTTTTDVPGRTCFTPVYQVPAPTVLFLGASNDVELPSNTTIAIEETLRTRAPPASPDAGPLPKSRIKRPMNAFMVYAQHTRAELRKVNPTLTNSSVSRILGSRWKSMPEDKKRAYFERAAELASEHKRMFPTYKFLPRRSINRKRRKGTNLTVLPTSKSSKHLAVPFVRDQDRDAFNTS